MNAQELQTALAHFSGTEEYHRHWLGLRMTDGVKFLADNAGAHWLVDAIASHQPEAMRDPMLKEMQFWTLKVNADDRSAILTCERDTDDVAITQEISYTDFPLDKARIWLSNRVMMLPNEY